MKENLNMMIDNPEPAEDGKQANTSFYLDRISLTIPMLMKLIEGLTKLSIAVLCAFIINTVVSALNRILANGTVSAKAMVAQILTVLRFPEANIRQAVAAVPSNMRISPNLPLYVFALFLPFVLISVLEAIALIRLRLGKGGTRTIGILHWIYCALDAIKLLALTVLAVVISLLSIIRLGGTFGIMLASIVFSLAVFFIPIRLPAMLYHRNIAGIMKDIRYEMKTGMQAVRRWANYRKILGFLIALQVAGTIISLMAYWRPTREDPAIATLLMIIIAPALTLLKYICVMFFFRNFMQADSSTEARGSVSHKPQLILIALITLFFVSVNVLLCTKSVSVSDALVQRATIFFNNAQQTVDKISNQADQKINEVEKAIDSQIGEEAASENPQEETTANPQEGTSVNPKQGTADDQKLKQQEETSVNSKQETAGNSQPKQQEEEDTTRSPKDNGSQD